MPLLPAIRDQEGNSAKGCCWALEFFSHLHPETPAKLERLRSCWWKELTEGLCPAPQMESMVGGSEMLLQVSVALAPMQNTSAGLQMASGRGSALYRRWKNCFQRGNVQIRAVTGLGWEYNLHLDYLCPMCLVLIILITASTAQDCLNLESGQLNSSLWAVGSCGCCEQVGGRWQWLWL